MTPTGHETVGTQAAAMAAEAFEAGRLTALARNFRVSEAATRSATFFPARNAWSEF